MVLLDSIPVNSSLIYLVVIVIIALCIYLFSSISTLKEEANKNNITIIQREGQLREKDLLIEKIQSDIKGNAHDLATVIFEEWKTSELETYQKIIEEAGLETANSMLNQWKIDNEKIIRKDASNRSVRVVLGKVTENLVPFTETFKFNPRDTRFIGSPIDLIVFDGLEEKSEEITIYFIEVKTGRSALSQVQNKVKDAIDKGRVKWELKSLRDFGQSVNDDLTKGV